MDFKEYLNEAVSIKNKEVKKQYDTVNKELNKLDDLIGKEYGNDAQKKSFDAIVKVIGSLESILKKV